MDARSRRLGASRRLAAVVALASACDRHEPAPSRSPEAALGVLRAALARDDAPAVYDALDRDSRWSVMSLHRAEREMWRLARAHFPPGAREAQERRYAAAGAAAVPRAWFGSLGLHVPLRASLATGGAPRREDSADGSAVFVAASGARLRFEREADGTWAFSGLRADLARRKEHAANALAIMQRSADEYRRGGTTRRDR
ncbi:MAG: hypothetical protein AABZ30_15050 [Myxococcota bacterium]